MPQMWRDANFTEKEDAKGKAPLGIEFPSSDEFIKQTRMAVELFYRNQLGKPAANLYLSLPDKSSFSIYDGNAKYTVLYFYNMDCALCEAVSGQMKPIYDEFRDKGVEVMAIYTGSSKKRKEWTKYIAEHGFEWTNLYDKKDSQDICFVKNGDYVSFIEDYCGKKFPEGNFVERSGKIIARHKGIIGYTVGQRKGLGIASTEPYFVLEKNVERNEVIIGRAEEQYQKSILADDVNWIAFEKLTSPIKLTAKIRYKHKEVPATVSQYDENRIIVEFDEPQRAPAKGQAVVFYDGDCVVGGGKIL